VRARAAVLALAAALAAGCGTETADLLIIEREGELPDAKLTLLVTDGLIAVCDGAEKPLPNERLLEARDLTDDLLPLLEKNPRLPVPEQALLRFRVKGESGEATFADASPGLPKEFGMLIQLTRNIARESCGKAR
jgi:hypothetical protein